MTGPSGHALLSPSSAHRWIRCPASVRLSEQVPSTSETASPYAHEGTLAHALAEIEASYRFGKITPAEYAEQYEAWRLNANLDLDTLGEMEAYIAGYLEFIEQRLEAHPQGEVMFERRVNTGVPKSWGTSDVIIFSPLAVEVIDLKYGQGHRVVPDDNEQLMLYGLGALDEVELLGDVETVYLSIYQPRVHDGVNTWEIDAEVLRSWRAEVAIPAAEEALGDDAHFGPGEAACRWCPAAGECRIRAQFLAGQDFDAPYVEVQRPDVLDPEEMAAVLDRIPQIRAWADAVEDAALRRLYVDGEEIPGWKSVLTYGRRFIPDQEKALAELVEQTGLDEGVFLTKPKLKGFTELSKIIGKKQVDAILEPVVEKSEGRASLVRESDKRQAVGRNNQAARDFDDDI